MTEKADRKYADRNPTPGENKGTGAKLSRRRLLAGAAAAASIALLRTATGQTIHAAVAAPPPSPAPPPTPPVTPQNPPTPPTPPITPADTTRLPGPPPGKLGHKSPFEHLQKTTSETSSRTPLQDLYGMITPSDLHFERHHSGVPTIDPAKYTLTIHGMVSQPTTFTLADLRRFPSVSRICFLECSGNFRTGKETLTPQDICGLTSQSEWTGVMLSTLFREVGASPASTWFLAEGSDAALMTRSVPMKKGWDDAIIAYAQNGEALRPEQGYPARLLLPGWEGNTCVKWIRRIECADQPFMTREETSKYTETVRDGKIRQFSFDMDARSIITFPAYPVQIPKGWVEIRGLAWSGRGKIKKVEVSTDAGKSWRPAQLQEPILDKAHTVFRLLWYWNGQETEILSRATDETDYLQPTLSQLIAARGTDMGGYHLNPVTAWNIKPDGRVLFKPEKWR